MFTLPRVKGVSIISTGSATHQYVGHSLFYTVTVELQKEKQEQDVCVFPT